MKVVFLSLAALLQSSAANRPPELNPPQVLPGTLSSGLYDNRPAGVRMHIPPGWTARLPTDGHMPIDPAHPDSALNQCSRVLLSIDADRLEGHSIQSYSRLIAINPLCFPGVNVPADDKDAEAVRAFAAVLVKLFHGTAFIPPSGVDIGTEHISAHQFIFLEGSGIRDSIDGKKQVHANTLISITQSGAHWIAWVSLVDDQAKKQLKHSQLQFLEE